MDLENTGTHRHNSETHQGGVFFNGCAAVVAEFTFSLFGALLATRLETGRQVTTNNERAAQPSQQKATGRKPQL